MNLQLLSPARDLTVAKAAIQAGADAVYIGAPRFGAREAAGNSLEDIAALVSYAQAFGVKVLVTLNTLLYPEEINEAFCLAQQLHAIGIDALIVQDLTFAELLFRELPDLRLHASTQCDNRTSEQVAQLHEMGFKRVVLARELSIEEIRAIHQAVPDIELEAFVHGALCVSYSGRCYMSEELLGRSANRGCCAQMCRMQYDLLDVDKNEVLDDEGKPIHQRYLLSLQDLDRSAYLAELIEAGVTTFKIEGRLKDAAYVTNITAYYRQKIDKIANRPIVNHPIVNVGFAPDPTKTFHRGATDYFLHGRTRPMANWQTPKSTGEYIGEVLEVRGNRLRVRLQDGITLHNGDGLAIGDEGFAVNGVEGNIIKTNKSLSTLNLQLPAKIYRNADTEFAKTLHSERRVPVDVLLEETENGYRLTYTPLDQQLAPLSGTFEAAHEAATNPERAEATLQQQLTKLGDSIYIAQSFKAQVSVMPFLPVSVLNVWRRQLTAISVPPAVPEVSMPAVNRPIVNHSSIINRPIINPLMTCRYCLLSEMGHCRKIKPLQKEPRFLRLRNSTTVQLRFDCIRCEMQILK